MMRTLAEIDRARAISVTRLSPAPISLTGRRGSRSKSRYFNSARASSKSRFQSTRPHRLRGSRPRKMFLGYGQLGGQRELLMDH